jgi:hypothetical protein
MWFGNGSGATFTILKKSIVSDCQPFITPGCNLQGGLDLQKL